MQSLILVCLCLAVVPISALVHYPNGAAVPLDAANLAATNAHLAAKGLIQPYAYGAHAAYAAHPYFLHGKKKRDAEADPLLVKYANGAVAPYDHNVAVATAQHYAAKAAHGAYPFVGAAGVHPAAAAVVPYAGVYPYAHAYAGVLPYAGVAGGLVHLPNGAVVPVEPLENQKARADHLAAKLALGRKKREADPEAEADPTLVYAGGILPYGYGYGFPLAHHVIPVLPFVHHPASGAIVPAEPLDVVKARAEHLTAHAAATAAALAA